MDEVEHMVQVLFEGKRVVGPQAFASTYESDAPLPLGGDANFYLIGHAYGHFVGFVVNLQTNKAWLLDPLPVSPGSDLCAQTVLQRLRAAYLRTYGRQLGTVVRMQCDLQPDSVQCALYCLRSAYLWLTNQPMLCAPGDEVKVDAQLARLADVAVSVRTKSCACPECRSKRVVMRFHRLAVALAERGLRVRAAQAAAGCGGVDAAQRVYLQLPKPTSDLRLALRPRYFELYRRLSDLSGLLRAAVEPEPPAAPALALSAPEPAADAAPAPASRPPAAAAGAAERVPAAPPPAPKPKPAPVPKSSSEPAAAAPAPLTSTAKRSRSPPQPSQPQRRRVTLPGRLPELSEPLVWPPGDPGSVEIGRNDLKLCVALGGLLCLAHSQRARSMQTEARRVSERQPDRLCHAKAVLRAARGVAGTPAAACACVYFSHVVAGPLPRF
jgi:hypothetical protein